MSHIFSIGTAVPAFKHQQADLLQLMIRLFQPSETERKKLRILYERSGIQERYSVMPDYLSAIDNQADDLLSSFTVTTASLEQRMKWYYRQALPLALQAVQQCLPAYLGLHQITHLITVSCTGLAAPGLDVELVQALDLQKNVYRTSVNFMGCYAAFHALKQADMICRTDPGALVLIVSVELCSLHFQHKFDEDNLRANLLFADGAAAALLCADQMLPRLRQQATGQQPEFLLKSLQIKSFYSEIAINGKNDMAWQLSGTGFLMTLSAYIPQLIEEGIQPLLLNALGHAALSPADISLWAVHPGGRKILEVIASALQLQKEQLQASYQVLKHYGNMSSATILFVLKEMWEKQLHWQQSQQVFAVGFGPGLTMESMILSS